MIVNMQSRQRLRKESERGDWLRCEGEGQRSVVGVPLS